MNLIEIIKSRRSHRKYSEKNISEKELRQIIECGVNAPFGGPAKPNCQVTELIIIKDNNVKKELALKYEDRQFIKSAPIIIACCANTKNDPDYKEWLLSASLSIQNILIAAESLNIGCCILSCFLNHEAHRKDKEYLKKVLGIPAEIELVALISMGYKCSDEIIPDKIMRNMDEIISFNTYGNVYES